MAARVQTGKEIYYKNIMPKSTSIKQIPACERPREKMVAKGVSNLRDSELLAILLGSGYRGKNVLALSKSILAKISRKKILSLTYSDLVKIKGVSQAKACTILAALELTKRALKIQDNTLPVIRSVKDIVAQAVYLRDKTREHLMVIYLNARNEMVFKKPMFIGTLNANLVHPREIFKCALEKNAASLILVHNHPSGDPEPSPSDIEITKQLKEAGKMMGIDVLDHVIITKAKAISFRQRKIF